MFTHMDIKGYIIEVSKAPIPDYLDTDDEYYLHEISEGVNSAYQICHHPIYKGPKIAYKNVHRRVKKLENYGLIEEKVMDRPPLHGRKDYVVTTRGLVYIFSELLQTRRFIDIVLSHQQNIIFKTFLDPYIQMRTVKNSTYTLTKLISNYIIECCEITKYCLRIASLYAEENEMIPESDLFACTPINFMYYRLNLCIQSFIVRSVILNEESEDYDEYTINKGWDPYISSRRKVSCLANDKKETHYLLARDKKFMSSLRETEKKFRTGFTALTDLTH